MTLDQLTASERSNLEHLAREHNLRVTQFALTHSLGQTFARYLNIVKCL